MQVGLLAEVTETSYQDSGQVSPLLEVRPSGVSNPFKAGSITRINVTVGGANYTDATTVRIGAPSTGRGFEGIPIVENGRIVGVRVVHPGEGYAAADPVILSIGNGAAATLEVVPNESSPSATARFQQRRIYAGTKVRPVTVFASQIGSPTEFYAPAIPAPADAFEFEIDSPELNTIKFLVRLPYGLLAFTSENIWRLSARQGFAPGLVNSEPLNFEGSLDIDPLHIKGSVLYVEEASQSIRTVHQGQNEGTYQSENGSQLSNHLFSEDNPVVSWTYAKSPHGLVWIVLEDGSMLSYTYAPEEGVNAVSKHSTAGKFKDVEVIREGVTDVVYLAVERTIDGNTVTFLESFVKRNVDSVRDIWGVDAGISAPTHEIQGKHYVSAVHLAGESVELLADGNVDANATVTVAADGAVRVSRQADKATVGLPFEGFVETLPPRTVEDPRGKAYIGMARPATIHAVILEVIKSRGISVSTDQGRTEPYVVAPRTDEAYGESVRFADEYLEQAVEPPAPLDPVGVRIYKRGPLQVTLTAVSMVLGDDVVAAHPLPVRHGR